MKRSIIVIGVVAAVAVGAGAYYMKRGDGAQAVGANAGNAGGRGGAPGGGGGGFGGPGGGGFGGPGGFGGGARVPMTVEMTRVTRADVANEITVVGNLIGAQTVEALPKVAGRLSTVNVRLGDRVAKGQIIAKIEDQEIQEQVKQQQAAYQVAQATIRQREAGLKQAQTNLDRSRNLFERQLVPKQTYDDVDAAYQSAAAQLDLANAQFAQAKARLDELQINLKNTVISSPVTGFVGKRALDPGAWVTTNSSFISVVDVSLVRLVANVVEKDIRRITAGLPAVVEVDAFPGEKFVGHVARVAPVLDPASRTGQIEVEITNSDAHLKPGMYARVTFDAEKHEKALVVPLVALVDQGGSRGVFAANDGEQGQTATFKPVEVGIMTDKMAEVTSGLNEGDVVITTGAAALREGDRVLTPKADGGGQGQGGGRRGGGAGAGGGRQGGGQGRRGAGAGGGQGAAPGQGAGQRQGQ